MTLPNAPLREVTPEETDRFWRDGVVCLRQIVPMEWIEAAAEGVEQWLRSEACFDYTAFGTEMAQAAGTALMVEQGERKGRFFSGQDHWQSIAIFRQLATESPLAPICAALLQTTKLNLYEDSILVKEPGALERTAFHQDIAYFHAEGHQICTTWLPLDPVSAGTGALQFVRGSHLWKAKYRPNFFTSSAQMPDTEGEAVPDFHKDRRSHDIISFDTEPGDLTVHHARTIHGAGGNTSAAVRRRAVSVRYCGDDARYRFRRGVPRKPHHGEITEGDLLDHAGCPVVWRARQAS